MNEDKTHKKKLYWFMKIIIDPKNNINKLLKYKKWLHTKNTTVQKSTIKKVTLLGRDLILGLGQGFQFQRIHDPKLLILVII